MIGRLKVALSCASFVDAGVVQVFALQVSPGVVYPRNLHPESVNAPADAPFTTTGRLTLFAFEEALLVTVGEVQRQSKDSGCVLHILDQMVQPPPAGTKLRVHFADVM